MPAGWLGQIYLVPQSPPEAMLVQRELESGRLLLEIAIRPG